LNIYADSSFVVSLYLRDIHTPEAVRRIARRPKIWLTPLHETEFTHAVTQQVFRGQISADEARRTFLKFAQNRHVWLLTPFPEGSFERAIELAHAHVARFGTRSLDSLHVASALELKAQQFWTFDERQAKLAKAAGLKIK
jgi:predicted nucleic acid-binding protein